MIMAGETRTIAIIGAGLMGHGIAQVFAVAGHGVRITDPQPAALGAVRAKIEANLRDLGLDLEAAQRVAPVEGVAACVQGADFVFEAAPENLELKQALFEEIEAAAPPSAVLASNTSVIQITKIMERVRDKSRALGTHWWNPPYLVPLVEVIRTCDVSDAVVARTIELLAAVGKTPVEVRKDVPGFVGNRLQHALWREAISLVENGVCDAQTVDLVVKASFGSRLAVLGPLENADMVGTDLTLAIHRQVLPHIENRAGPSPLLESMVSQGRLGFKSGEGFRRWTPEEQQALRLRVLEHLSRRKGAD